MPPALWPALAVLACAATAASTDLTFRSALPALPVIWLIAAAAVRFHVDSVSVASIAAGFGLCSALLAAHARDAAIHTPLRNVLDERIGHFLIDGLEPENDHDPMPVRARLLEDAAGRGDYVSLRARVMA